MDLRKYMKAVMKTPGKMAKKSSKDRSPAMRKKAAKFRLAFKGKGDKNGG